MATTDLKLEECGSLSKPGPFGRLVRIGFGALCLYYVVALWGAGHDLITEAGTIRPLVWNGILPGLFLVNYVVNIGFSRAWRKWPAIISIVLLLTAAIGYMQAGFLEIRLLAHVIQVWELYVFLHLGGAFVLASLIATPGCEMRAFHHLFSLVTRRPTKEHRCPVGPLTPID